MIVAWWAVLLVLSKHVGAATGPQLHATNKWLANSISLNNASNPSFSNVPTYPKNLSDSQFIPIALQVHSRR